MSIDDVAAKVKIHVVPSDSQEVPLIVGHPYTKQPHKEIVGQLNQLTIGKVVDVVDDDHAGTTTIRAREDAVVPNNYVEQGSAQI